MALIILASRAYGDISSAFLCALETSQAELAILILSIKVLINKSEINRALLWHAIVMEGWIL